MAITAASIVAEFKSNGADKVAGDMRRLGNETDAAAKKGSAFSNIMQTGMGFLAGGLALAGIGQIKDIGKAWLGAGLNFEQGMANISAVTGATGAELKSLQDLALKIGKDTTFGATEATQAIEELAKAGVSTENILNGAADGATALAAAGGVALPEAASVMAAAMNQFGLDGSQATHIADLLAAAASTSATGVSELGESLKYVGTTAAQMGISIEDTITALAILGDNGLQGSVAGTALNSALTSLINPSNEAATRLNELGFSLLDVNGNMKDLPTILADLNTAFAGLSPADRLQAIYDIFGTEGAKAIIPLLNAQTESAKEAGKSWQDYYKSVNQDGAAADQAAARMNSTMGAIEGLKGSLETLAIITSMAVLPAFRGLIEGASGVVDGVSGFITSMQSYMANGESFFTAFSLSARTALYNMFGLDGMNAIMPFVDGALDGLQMLISGIQAVAGVVGDILGAALGFLGDHIGTITQVILPAVAAFFALNKAIAAVNAVSTAAPAAISAIRMGMASMNPWVLAAAAAVALFALAWKNNWFGIQDKVKAGFAAMKPVLNDARKGLEKFFSGDMAAKGKVLTNGINSLAKGVDLLGKRFPALALPLGVLSAGLRTLPGLVGSAASQFQTFLDQGMNPVAAGFATLGVGFQHLSEMFPQFGGFFAGMRDQMIGFGAVAMSVGSGVSKLFSGDFTGALRDFGTAASQVWDNVLNGAQTLWTGVQELGAVIGDALGGIDWGGLASGAMDIGSSILSGLGDIAGSIGSWLGEQFGAINWGEVGSTISTKFGEMMSTVFAIGQDIGEGALAIGEQVGSWLKGQFDSIPWSDVGTTISTKMSEMLSTVFAIGQDIGEGALNIGEQVGSWIKGQFDSIDWPGVGERLKTNFSTMMDGLFQIGEDLGAGALDIGEQVGSWIKGQFENVDWSAVGETLKTKFGDAMKGAFSIGEAVGGAEAAGIDLATDVLSWITDQLNAVDWENVGTVFGELLGNAIKGAIVGGAALVGLGASYAAGILSSLLEVDWANVATVLFNLLKASITATGDFFKGMFKGLWDGLTDGLEEQVARVTEYLGNMLNQVISWVNQVIAALNKLPGKDIPPIPLIVTPKVNFHNAANDAIASATTAGRAAGVAMSTAMAQEIASNQSIGVAAATMVGQSVYKALEAVKASMPQPMPVPEAPSGLSARGASLGNRTITTTFEAVGGEAVAAVAASVTAAVSAVPTSWMTTILQAGGEAVAAVSNAATAAINAIPTSHMTAILQAGAEAVTGAANAAAAAINAIPTSHNTTFTAVDAGATAVAASVAAAIAAIPDSKTVTVSTVTGAARAIGGYVTGGLTRLAELGPELVAMPNGDWFMAMKDALYPTPLGSYVYTAGQTSGMMSDLVPVSAYANGGWVGGRGSAPRGGSSRGDIVLNLNIEGNVYGIDDLEVQVGRTLITTMKQELENHQRANGVMR